MKDEFINQILNTYTKVCFSQGVDENQDYRMGLKVGAEIMYNNLESVKLLTPKQQ